MLGKFPDAPRRIFFKIIARSAALASFALLASCGGGSNVDAQKWIASWYASPQAYNEPPLSAKDPKSFKNQTVRQLMYLSAGGEAIRIRVSNVLGTTPLVIDGMRVAKSIGGTSIDVSTDRQVTFDGKATVAVPAGQEILSDSIALTVLDQTTVAVSTFVTANTPIEMVHSLGLQSNYVVGGNVMQAPAFTPTETNQFFLWVTGIDVQRRDTPKVIVAFGDSITDGYNSTPNTNNRYPNLLSNILMSSGTGTYSVINAGISGNRWSFDGIGPNGTGRFNRDVLNRAGITSTVILLGINDIGIPSLLGLAAQQVTPDQIIKAISDAAVTTKAKGIKVYVGTLTPFGGTTIPGYYTAAGEIKRQAINTFIRSTTLIDGVIDYDLAIRDAATPGIMDARYDSGDHLHPNDTGYAVMAAAAAKILSK